MELSHISKFFNEKSLETIIIEAGGTKYTSYKFGKGFKKGDSYLSNVYRLSVYGVNENDGSKKQVNLVIKSMPDNAARRRVFRSDVFFRNEINFYTKVIPAFEAFQAKKNPKHPFVEYPKYYLSYCNGTNDFIALEDVGDLGYGTPNRQGYITLDECLLTMRTLGRFHGVSLAFVNDDPQGFNEAVGHLDETYYSEKFRSWYIGFLRLATTVAIDAVSKSYPGTKYEEISKKFLQESLYSDLIKLVSTRSKLSVVSHGDCWTPNFLTRYRSDGSPEAIKVIDFQLARCSSLALDISFFIYSCTSQELREEHFDDLLKEYHTSACSLIAELGGDPDKILPYAELLDELKRFGRFGCGMGIESLPMSLLDDEEIGDLDSIKETDVLTDIWNIVPFKEPSKRQRIADIFKHAIDSGFIQ